MERLQGTRPGSIAARTYAAALHELGRTVEAQAVLQRQLDNLPPSERETADQLRLMLGLIAGATSEPGRRAFLQLVERSQRPETQQIALQLLARGARTPAERARLRADLTRWLATPGGHPIAEELVLTRALLRLADGLNADAESDARRLLDDFPGSPLRPAALGVRLAVAWEQRRYRSVADIAVQLRSLLPAGRERAELGILLA